MAVNTIKTKITSSQAMKFFAVLATILLAAPSKSMACKCIPPQGIKFQKVNSDMSFSGTAISAEYESSKNVFRTKFAVRSIWVKGKKESRKWVFIETHPKDHGCGIEFEIGKRAIVFAIKSKPNENDIYTTNLCMGNILDPSKTQLDSMKSSIKRHFR